MQPNHRNKSQPNTSMKKRLTLLKWGSILALFPLLVIVLNLQPEFEILQSQEFLNWFNLASIGFVISFMCFGFYLYYKPSQELSKSKSRNTALILYVISTPIFMLVYIYVMIVS